MMSAPFLLLGAGGFLFWRASKKTRPEGAASNEPS
jgi:hypothetical protein